jgi:hypothetical protein
VQVVADNERFVATLTADERQLHPLRFALASWLEEAGLGKDSRQAVVLAVHEATAATIDRSGAPIVVRARLHGESIAVQVAGDRDWSAMPELDEDGFRMRLIRALASAAFPRKTPAGVVFHMELTRTTA